MGRSPVVAVGVSHRGSRGGPSGLGNTGDAACPRFLGSPKPGPPRTLQAHSGTFCRQRSYRSRPPILRAQPEPRPESEPDREPDFQGVPRDYVWGNRVLQQQHEQHAELEQELHEELDLAKQLVDNSTGLLKPIALLKYHACRAVWRHMVSERIKTFETDRDLKSLSKVAEQHKSSQGSPSAANPTTDTQPDTPSLNASALADLVELLKDESAARHRQRRPAHMRARSYCNSGVLFCALGAALTSPLFGVNFQEHWHLPQTWSSWAAFTAVYLVSLVSISSSDGGASPGSNMHQLNWFPPLPAQPGITSLVQVRQDCMQDLAALDLKQATQFATLQAVKISYIWRGVLLVLVYSVLQGKGTGVEAGLHGASLQSPFLGGLVALPSWAQSQLILQAAVITAVGEALAHEVEFSIQGWAQPDDPDAKKLEALLDSATSKYVDTVGTSASVPAKLGVLKALGVSWSGERISQHALVSALLALQVLVTGSLPGAMLTQALGYMLGWQSVRSQLSLNSSAEE